MGKSIIVACVFFSAVMAHGQGCKSLVVKNSWDKQAKAWNCFQRDSACRATKDMPENGAKKGDHYACDQTLNAPKPPRLLHGYRMVFVASGCPDCAVGWLYFAGEECSARDLNCMD